MIHFGFRPKNTSAYRWTEPLETTQYAQRYRNARKKESSLAHSFTRIPRHATKFPNAPRKQVSKWFASHLNPQSRITSQCTKAPKYLKPRAKISKRRKERAVSGSLVYENPSTCNEISKCNERDQVQCKWISAFKPNASADTDRQNRTKPDTTRKDIKRAIGSLVYEISSTCNEICNCPERASEKRFTSHSNPKSICKVHIPMDKTHQNPIQHRKISKCKTERVIIGPLVYENSTTCNKTPNIPSHNSRIRLLIRAATGGSAIS